MKRICSIILFCCLLQGFVIAQNDTAKTLIMPGDVSGMVQALALQDSGAVDTSMIIYSWTIDAERGTVKTAVVDTVLDNFQKQDPVYRKYVSFSTTGNYSQPSINNIFSDGENSQEFIFVNSYFPYMKMFRNTSYINTRKPFTKPTYLNGQSGSSKFELLDAFHSQNISPRLNAGLNITTSRAYGQYSFQRTRNNSFSLFGSYSGSYYSSNYSININKIIADENGGILDDRLITDTVISPPGDIPTLFEGNDSPPVHDPDVSNEVKNISIFTMQEVALNRDTSANAGAFNPTLGYIFYLDRYVKLFRDKNPSVGKDSGLYDNVYINQDATSDSMLYWKLYNGIRIQNRGRNNNRIFADAAFETMKYSMSAFTQNPVADTLLDHWFLSQEVKFPSINYSTRQYNFHISSGADLNLFGHAATSLYGRYYLTGYRHGDFLFSGNISLFSDRIKEKGWIMLFNAGYESKSPDYFFTHYASNNFIWTHNYRKTIFQDLSMNISHPSNKFDLSLNNVLIRGFIYFNERALPVQFSDILNVMTVSLSKEFNFWKITSNNTAVYQHVSNDQVLSLPAFSFVSSTYFTHMFNFRSTGGKLLTIAGFDLRYNTGFYGNAYMPPLSSFYQQREKILGNYPYIDVYLNVRLKRFRFFVKFEHVNSGWIDRNYFTTLHYPMNERNLNFGLSWTFYD
jgi:hypothetical protein